MKIRYWIFLLVVTAAVGALVAFNGAGWGLLSRFAGDAGKQGKDGAVADSSRAAAGGSKGETKAKAKVDKPEEVVAKNLKDGKNVVLYFYADSISDSLNDYKNIEKALAGNKQTVIVKAEAYKYPDLRFNYGLEYVPTVFVIRPGMGIVDAHVVDIYSQDIGKNLDKKFKPPAGVAAIQKGTAAKKPTLVFFMADWCGYCQRVIPEVDNYKRDYGDSVNIARINIEEDPATAEWYLISGVPVLVALDANGGIYKRLNYPVGYKDFESVFKELGVKKKGK